jgi:processive 1,2-diacylglycerol beta-glucosyltransferase
MNVLFLSVSTGGGHFKAAEALKDKIEEMYPDSKTLIVDTIKYVNPIIDKLIVGGYLSTVKKTPQIYGKLYTFTETGDNINDFSRTVNKLMSFKIRRLINEFNPSVIICTHPLPLQMLSILKKSGKVQIPTIAILTDYASHPLWLHKHIDAYVVAHSSMKYEMMSHGIPEDIIYPIGIPVSYDFLQIKDRKAILNEMQLEDKMTVLIMGGSLGFGEVCDTFKSLLTSKRNLQIIAITGQNPKLKRQLEKLVACTKKHVKIFSYTDKVADLMEVSDFIITKPGGMTITEALVKSLPIFVTSPLPGVEERNSHFLMNNGAAVRLLDTDNIESILNQILDNPLRLNHMKAMASYLAKPNSTEDIIALIERLLKAGTGL